jgi:hypothetical protein
MDSDYIKNVFPAYTESFSLKLSSVRFVASVHMVCCDVSTIGGQEVDCNMNAFGRLASLFMPTGRPASCRQGKGRVKMNVRAYLTSANSTPKCSSPLLL